MGWEISSSMPRRPRHRSTCQSGWMIIKVLYRSCSERAITPVGVYSHPHPVGASWIHASTRMSCKTTELRFNYLSHQTSSQSWKQQPRPMLAKKATLYKGNKNAKLTRKQKKGFAKHAQLPGLPTEMVAVISYIRESLSSISRNPFFNQPTFEGQMKPSTSHPLGCSV